MSKKILTTRFNYSMPADDLKITMSAVAPEYSKIPGCIWKIWLISEDQKEAGGIYLFDSNARLEEFLKSPLFASVASNPHFSHLQTYRSGIDEAASVITGAPF